MIAEDFPGLNTGMIKKIRRRAPFVDIWEITESAFYKELGDETFYNEIEKSALSPGDVAIVRTGYPGTAAVIPEWLNKANCADLVIATPAFGLDPYYLAIFLNSSFGRALVGANIVGAAQKHFNVTAAKKVSIPVPPIEQQRQLVRAVESLSSQIKITESQCQLKLTALKELKQSLLQKAFSGELTTDMREVA